MSNELIQQLTTVIFVKLKLSLLVVLSLLVF